MLSIRANSVEPSGEYISGFESHQLRHIFYSILFVIILQCARASVLLYWLKMVLILISTI